MPLSVLCKDSVKLNSPSRPGRSSGQLPVESPISNGVIFTNSTKPLVSSFSARARFSAMNESGILRDRATRPTRRPGCGSKGGSARGEQESVSTLPWLGPNSNLFVGEFISVTRRRRKGECNPSGEVTTSWELLADRRRSCSCHYHQPLLFLDAL